LITERLKVGIAELSDISNITVAIDGEVNLIEGGFVVLNDEIIDLSTPFADDCFGSLVASATTYMPEHQIACIFNFKKIIVSILLVFANFFIFG